MRKKVAKRNPVHPDMVFNSVKVARLINYVMLDGKKNAARKSVYKAFDIVKEKTENPNPLEVFDQAIKNAAPTMEVRSRRLGGANYQVPHEVRAERRLQLALRWMVQEARKSSGRPMADRLAQEIINAANGEGGAVKRRDNTMKMAEANKAFAHLAW